MDRKKRISAALLLALFLAAILSVPYGRTAQAAVPKINKTRAMLREGEWLRLRITGTKKEVTWSSNRRNVAAVNSRGLVRARGKGTARITAKVGKRRFTCKVTVKAKALEITPAPTVTDEPEKPLKLSTERMTLSAGDYGTLCIFGTNQEVEWYSTDETVATVSSDGVVYGVHAGDCRIYAEIPGRYFMCMVSVFDSTVGTPTGTPTPTPGAAASALAPGPEEGVPE